MQTPALSTVSLTKTFGSFMAVKAVDFRIEPGMICALVGPNGAGKTTFLKMIVGLLRPTSGTVSVFGHDTVTESMKTKSLIGYVSDDPVPYDYLTGREFLLLTGRLCGMNGQKLDHRITRLLDMFPLENTIDVPVREYSRGSRQKVAFLAALLSGPKLLVIDEPIVGLDPESIGIFGRALKAHADEGNAVVFVTHILPFAKKYATHAATMAGGKIGAVVETSKLHDLESLVRES